MSIYQEQIDIFIDGLLGDFGSFFDTEGNKKEANELSKYYYKAVLSVILFIGIFFILLLIVIFFVHLLTTLFNFICVLIISLIREATLFISTFIFKGFVRRAILLLSISVFVFVIGLFIHDLYSAAIKPEVDKSQITASGTNKPTELIYYGPFYPEDSYKKRLKHFKAQNKTDQEESEIKSCFKINEDLKTACSIKILPYYYWEFGKITIFEQEDFKRRLLEPDMQLFFNSATDIISVGAASQESISLEKEKTRAYERGIFLSNLLKNSYKGDDKKFYSLNLGKHIGMYKAKDTFKTRYQRKIFIIGLLKPEKLNLEHTLEACINECWINDKRNFPVKANEYSNTEFGISELLKSSESRSEDLTLN